MPAPTLGTVPEFYHSYIRRVTADTAQTALSGHFEELVRLLEGLDEDAWHHAYAPGKWTIKELVQHLIDAERIFCHRALCIARQDGNPLPGFDENAYAEVSAANDRTGASLLRELRALETSTQCLFESFGDEQLVATGIANSQPISVNAIAYIITGHTMHHTRVVQERYLVAMADTDSL